MRTKIIFEARVLVPENHYLISNTEKIAKDFFVITPFSPAARNGVGQNPIIVNWLQQNPGQSRQELLRLIYNRFLTFNENDKTWLYNLNYNAI